MKYAYQELPHPTDTASPHSQKVERRSLRVFYMFKDLPFLSVGDRRRVRIILDRSLKSEICVSGIATLRKHSVPTQRKIREKKRACVYMRINFKKDITNN
jgi:hypothetical protein